MKTILIAQFKHETNRFSDYLTDLDCYRARNCLVGEELIPYFQGMKNEMGGFLDVLGACADIQLLPVVALDAMPGGPVARDVFAFAWGHLRRAIADTRQLDGVLLCLHGAMVLTDSEDGEGDLLEAIRGQAGADLPVIASLDLHANITEKMQHHATALVAFREYPHTDMYETGKRAAALMRDTLRGVLSPVLHCRKLPLMMPYMPTDAPVMQKLHAKADEYIRKGVVLEADICHGFFSADIAQMGACVVVIADAAQEAAARIADELAQMLWERRHSLAREYHTIFQAIDEIKHANAFPVVLADVADNPGAGAPGDATHILRALLENGIREAALATIYDPETVQQAMLEGEGGKLQVCLGGKLCPKLCGLPVETEAEVLHITGGQYRNRDSMGRGMLVNMGPTAVLSIQGICVIVASERIQPWDAEVFRSCGISPEKQKVLVVKSTLHYRHSFEKFAGRMLDVELPGVAPQSPMTPSYRHCKRPVFPLDDI